MSKNIQRVAKLETGLTPKQAILLWFQEAHGFGGPLMVSVGPKSGKQSGGVPSL